ncbi:DUF5663 domain-containing protein [Gordonia sp. N1V]|uniref:DUF5663 domain-containing protein n=1 Tax=Gordonia sp. N1V TaxID=3034163 RepID=UPI0023E1AA93|nr:DUF5663 domain-containing protein [Gordonia sp. N1V]MDF3284964.1 DUF5663 domain-containing protein [Gordonia sp. N1V]
MDVLLRTDRGVDEHNTLSSAGRLSIVNQVMEDLGIFSFPSETRDLLVTRIASLIDLKIGRALAACLSDRRLHEFEELMSTSDDGAMANWLERELPNFRTIVTRETDELVERLLRAYENE